MLPRAHERLHFSARSTGILDSSDPSFFAPWLGIASRVFSNSSCCRGRSRGELFVVKLQHHQGQHHHRGQSRRDEYFPSLVVTVVYQEHRDARDESRLEKDITRCLSPKFDCSLVRSIFEGSWDKLGSVPHTRASKPVAERKKVFFYFYFFNTIGAKQSATAEEVSMRSGGGGSTIHLRGFSVIGKPSNEASLLNH